MQIQLYMKNSLINSLFGQGDLFSSFDEAVDNVIESSFDSYKFRTTVQQEEDCYLIHAQAPGLSKDDIEITLDDGLLQVRGEKTINENMTCSINKNFTLGRDIDGSKITAKIENGLIEIKIEKKARLKTKKIKIT